MAYDKRQDPGELTPFSDNVMFRNLNNSSGTSVTINFPNTPRKKREVELYDLSRNFHSITGYDYTSSASLLTHIRFNETGGYDLKSPPALGIVPKDSSGAGYYDESSILPFIAPAGAVIPDYVKSLKMSDHFIELNAGGDATLLSPATYSGEFSMSFWLNTNSTNQQTIVLKAAADREFELLINTSGQLEFISRDASARECIVTSSLIVSQDTWHHIVLASSGDWTTAESGIFKIYIDAEYDSDISISTDSSFSGLITDSSIIFMGTASLPVSDTFSGLIAEFAMWSTRLDETEIIAIYDSSSGLSDKMDTTAIDGFRQGVSILTNKHKYSSTLFKLSSGQQRRNGHPDHYVEQREFGQPKAHLDGMAFNDIKGRFTPYVWDEPGGIQIINNTDTQQYPVVYVENIVDPSRFDGVIEPLTIRYAVTNNAIDSPFHAHDIRGDIMGGNGNQLQGVDLIINDIKLKEGIKQDIQKYVDDERGGGAAPIINDNPFYDADERTEKDGVIIPKPGFVSDTRNTDVTFNDTQRIIVVEIADEAVVIAGDDPDPAVTTDDFMVEIDKSSGRQRHTDLIKSAQSGFIYSNNAKFGTDSLAFGGLTRK